MRSVAKKMFCLYFKISAKLILKRSLKLLKIHNFLMQQYFMKTSVSVNV